jgi:hypothetical protein
MCASCKKHQIINVVHIPTVGPPDGVMGRCASLNRRSIAVGILVVSTRLVMGGAPSAMDGHWDVVVVHPLVKNCWS